MRGEVENNGGIGWRFAVGVVLIAGGYAALALLPVVVAANLKFGVKTALTSLIAFSPLLAKIAAVAVIGKAGFNYLKDGVFTLLGKFRPAQQVGRLRYRIGLVLFVLPIVLGMLERYASEFISNRIENEILWSSDRRFFLDRQPFRPWRRILGQASGAFYLRCKSRFCRSRIKRFPPSRGCAKSRQASAPPVTAIGSSPRTVVAEVDRMGRQRTPERIELQNYRQLQLSVTPTSPGIPPGKSIMVKPSL